MSDVNFETVFKRAKMIWFAFLWTQFMFLGALFVSQRDAIPTQLDSSIQMGLYFIAGMDIVLGFVLPKLLKKKSRQARKPRGSAEAPTRIYFAIGPL